MLWTTGLLFFFGAEAAGKYGGFGGGGPQWVDYPAYSLAAPPHSGIGRKKNGGPVPLFDIMVEPEYIPDPFPIPYPFPIDSDNAPAPAPKDNKPPEPPQQSRKPKYKRKEYIERAAVTWTCPNDFVKEANKCVRIDQVQIQIGCASGWKYQNGICHAVDVQGPQLICDEGYEPWENGIECVRNLYAPKEMHCRDGYESNTGGCERHVESSPTAICGDAELVGSTCKRKVSSKPSVSCPAEFSFGPDGVSCLRESIHPGELFCPGVDFGLTPDGQCKKNKISQPQRVCPPNQRLEGNLCIQEYRQLAKLVCLEGFLNQQELCEVVSDRVSPNHICPEGYLLDEHGECFRKILSQLSIECPKGTVYEAQTRECIGRVLSKKKLNTPLALSSPVCPPHATEIEDGSGCLTIEKTLPDVACPRNYVLQQSECEMRALVQPLIECPEGMSVYVSERMCTHTQTSQAQSICHGGYVLTDEGNCLQVDTAHAMLKCPIGFEPDVLQKCRKVEKLEAEYTCPPTMALSRRHVGGSCEGDEYFDPQLMCTVAGMSLVATAHGAVCKGVQIEPPMFSCPLKYREEAFKCVKQELSPKKKICDEGYHMTFDACIRPIEQEPLLLCPEGYVSEHNELCTKKRTADLIPECPSDMDYDRLVGECYKMRVDYAFDEEAKPANEELKDLNVPEESLKDLSVPSTTTTVSPVVMAPYMAPPYPPPPPPPQLVLIQQPVAIPQPAIILPAQAPVPPPPAIRVPYAVPQPVPVKQHHHK